MKQLLLLFTLSFLPYFAVAQDLVHPGGMHTTSQLEAVRLQIRKKQSPTLEAFQQLLLYADSARNAAPNAMPVFSVPGYYVDAEGHRRNSRALQKDAFNAYAAALAAQLTGKKQYTMTALRFLNDWGAKNTGYSDADGPLVMAYSGTAMIMAADLLYHTPEWRAEDKALFTKWVRSVYKKACDEIRNRKNNWADWGRYGSILAAHYLNDRDEIRENIRLIKSDLADKIGDDGSMPHETKRGANGIWYTYFSLAPITSACWVAHNTAGENIFTYEQRGRSLKKALDYLLHYTLQPESWPWFDKPNRGSESRWPGNLFEALSEIYKDERYAGYSKKAQPICYPVHHFGWTFPTLMKPGLRID